MLYNFTCNVGYWQDIPDFPLQLEAWSVVLLVRRKLLVLFPNCFHVYHCTRFSINCARYLRYCAYCAVDRLQ